MNTKNFGQKQTCDSRKVLCQSGLSFKDDFGEIPAFVGAKVSGGHFRLSEGMTDTSEKFKLNRYKTALVGVFLCMTWMFPVSASSQYPWPDFYGEPASRAFSIGAQSSFFLKQKNWLHLVPTVDLKYSNLMVDVDLGWQYSLPEKKHYFRLSEMALTFPIPFSSKWNFSLGFKKHKWSKADIYWNLGLWQPRYMVDPFRPVQMGRPGFYLNYKGLSTFTLHLSYLAFPDLHIIPKLTGGGIQSENPFFISPVTLEEDSDKTSPTQWDIKEMPSLKWDTFLKPVVALHTFHKLPHFQLSVAYAYKPSHRLRYFVFANQCTPSQIVQGTCAISGADYSVGYHHLFSVEGEMSPLKNVTLHGALIYENPRELPRGHSVSDITSAFFKEKKDLLSSPSPPVSLNGQKGHWVSSVSRDHLTASVFLYYREGEENRDQTQLSVGYLRPLWREKNPNNSFVTSLAPLFGRNFSWIHAISFSLEHEMKSIFHGYKFQFRLNHALDNKMYQAGFENRLNLLPFLQVSLSGDVLFQADHQELKSGSSSIQLYKNHSRILVGASCVF